MRSQASARARRTRATLLCAMLGFAVVSSLAAADTPPRADPDSVGTVEGRLTREGKPAAYAVVDLVGLRMGTMTDDDGRFRLTGVPVGSRSIVFRAFSCEPLTVSVTVRRGSVTRLDTTHLGIQPFADNDRSVPADFMANPEERARVGSRCRVHWRITLRSDTVAIHHGITGYSPGSGGEERERFPNAREWWPGGCVVDGTTRTEVAYCRDCRRSYARWLEQKKRAQGPIPARPGND